jgi:hypothetical protein
MPAVGMVRVMVQTGPLTWTARIACESRHRTQAMQSASAAVLGIDDKVSGDP